MRHSKVDSNRGTVISASNFLNQPYAVPARVALIANELDLAVDFNCKSGKDRTGMLDAQIQALMADLVIRNPGLQYKPEPTVRVEETEQTPAPAVNIPKLRSRSENTALVLKKPFLQGACAPDPRLCLWYSGNAWNME